MNPMAFAPASDDLISLTHESAELRSRQGHEMRKGRTRAKLRPKPRRPAPTERAVRHFVNSYRPISKNKRMKGAEAVVMCPISARRTALFMAISEHTVS